MAELTTAPPIETPEDADILPIRKGGLAGLLQITLAQIKAFVLEGFVGGVEEAPLDGKPYVRQDAEWVDPPEGSLPPGGLTGQLLAKDSNADGDAIWVDPPEGTGGGGGGGGGSAYAPIEIIQASAGTNFHAGNSDLVFPDATVAGSSIVIIIGTYSQASATVPAGFEPAAQVAYGNQLAILFVGESNGTDTYSVGGTDWGFAMAYEVAGEIGLARMVGHITSPEIPAAWGLFVSEPPVAGESLRILVGKADTQETWALDAAAGVTQDFQSTTNAYHTGLIGRLDKDYTGLVTGTRTGTSPAMLAYFEVAGSYETVSAGPIIVLSQAEYDAISAPDEATFYYVEEEA